MVVFSFFGLLSVVVGIANTQEVFFKGDKLDRLLSPVTHIQFSYKIQDVSKDPKLRAAVSVSDTISVINSLTVQNCERYTVLPSDSSYIMKFCAIGMTLDVDKIGASFGSITLIARYPADPGMMYNDVAELIHDNKPSGYFVSLQSNIQEAKVSVQAFASQSSIKSLAISLQVGDSKILKPTLAVFCFGTASCKVFVYDKFGSDKPAVIVLEVDPQSFELKKLSEFLMIGSTVVNYPHKTALITQYVDSIFYVASTAAQGVMYVMGLTSDFKLVNKTLQPQVVPGYGGDKVVFSSHQSLYGLNLITVVVGKQVSIVARATLFQVYGVTLDIPDCGFDMTKIMDLKMIGSVTSIRYSSESGTGTGYVIMVRTPTGGSKPEARCIGAPGVTHVLFDKERNEIMEVTGTGAKVYSMQLGRYRVDTGMLDFGMFTLQLMLTDGSGKVGMAEKPFWVLPDPYQVKSRANNPFIEMMVNSSKWEVFTNGQPNIFQVTRTDLLNNGGKYSIEGQNLAVFSTIDSKVKYVLPAGAPLAVLRVALARRGKLLLQRATNTLESFDCRLTTLATRTCTAGATYSVEGVPVSSEKLGIYSLRSGTHFVVLSGLDSTFTQHSLRLYSITSTVQVSSIQISGSILDIVWVTNGNFGQLIFTKKGEDKDLFKVVVTQSSLEESKVTLTLPKMGTQICVRNLAPFESSSNEVTIHSSCPNGKSSLYTYDISSNPSISIYERDTHLSTSYTSLKLCSMHLSTIYMDIEKNELRARTKSGDDISYNFPSDSDLTTMTACVYEVAMFLAVRKDKATKKFSLHVYNSPRGDTEAIGMRVKAVVDIFNDIPMEDVSMYMMQAEYEVRDHSVHVIIVKKADPSVNSILSYEIQIDEGDIIFLSNNNETIKSIDLTYTGYKDTNKNTTKLQFTSIQPKGQVDIKKYQPLPQNQAGKFDMTKYLEIEGNYMGIQVKGPNSERVTVSDRLRKDGASLPSSIMGGSHVIASASKYVIIGKKNSKAVLYSDIFSETRSSINLDELPYANEAVMYEDKSKGFVVIILRRSTFGGNDFVMYWFKVDSSFPPFSSGFAFHKWSQEAPMGKMRLYHTSIRKEQVNHFLLTLVSPLKTDSLTYTIQFTQSYSSLLIINKQHHEGPLFYEDYLIGRDRKSFTLKMRGAMLYSCSFEPNGDYIGCGVSTAQVYQGKAIFHNYCSMGEKSFCLSESSTQYLFYEDEIYKGSFEKILGHKTIGWLSSPNYVGLVLERIRIPGKVESLERKLAVYKRGYIGCYSEYQIPMLNMDSILDEEISSHISIVERSEDIVILLSETITETNNLKQNPSDKVSLPVVHNKIEIDIQGSGVSSELLKFILKGVDESSNNVRGLVMDPGVNYTPPVEEKPSIVWIYWLLFAIVMVGFAIGCYFVCKHITKEDPSELEAYKVAPSSSKSTKSESRRNTTDIL